MTMVTLEWMPSVHALRAAEERSISRYDMMRVVEHPTVTYPSPKMYSRWWAREIRSDDVLAVVVDLERREIVTVMFRDPMRHHAQYIAAGFVVPPCNARGSKRKPYYGPLCATCLKRVKLGPNGRILDHSRPSDGHSVVCVNSGRTPDTDTLVCWKDGIGPETEWFGG